MKGLDLELEEITNPELYPTVIHGTYDQAWQSIQRQVNQSQNLRSLGQNPVMSCDFANILFSNVFKKKKKSGRGTFFEKWAWSPNGGGIS